MIYRELGLEEVENRIVTAKDDLGLKGFKRTPTRPIDKKYLPCVFMSEGIDEVISHSSRNAHGYPCRRALEVTLEIATDDDQDIKALFTEVRNAVFNGGVVVADNNTFIREIRTEGPTGYDLPDMLGIRMVLALVYTDDGILTNP